MIESDTVSLCGKLQHYPIDLSDLLGEVFQRSKNMTMSLQNPIGSFWGHGPVGALMHSRLNCHGISPREISDADIREYLTRPHWPLPRGKRDSQARVQAGGRL